MKIGIAGPILTGLLAGFLDGKIDKAPKGLGGTSVVQLVKGLLRKGNRVSVYSLDGDVIAPVVVKGKFLTIYYGPYRRRHRMRDFMKVERQSIRDSIIADKPDIVHAHWTYEFAVGALSGGKPTLITVRDRAIAILRLRPDAYRFGRLIMHYYTIFRGGNFTATSPYIQKSLIRYKGGNIPVIPNALDDEYFYKGKRHLHNSQPRIVSVNNGFGKCKNVKALLRAFRLIKTRVPSCRLILIGDDFEKNGIAEQWANENELAEGVDFLGHINHTEVLSILETAHLLIHPSLEESFGMTLLEAMAKKTPVMGGDKSGAVPWVLDYGKAGVLTDVKSPRRLADSAISILTNEDQWYSYSRAGFDHAWENFRLSKVVDQYIEEYRKLVTYPKNST